MVKKYSLRLPDELHKALKESAKRNHRSLHGEMLRALEFYLRNSPEANYFYEAKKQGPEKEDK